MKLFANTYFLLAFLLILGIIDLFVGSINIFSSEFNVSLLLFEIRLPKVMTAISAGGALSLCGLLLQILFRNPLAGPYVLGISSAASLFTAIGIMSTGFLTGLIYYFGISIFSVVGAALGMMIILLILRVTSHITVILLAGLMLSQFYAAVQSVLSYMSNEHALKIYTLWTMGSIQNTDFYQSLVLMMMCIAGLLWAMKFTKALMVYLTGDETAMVMGIDIQKMKRKIIVSVSVMVGIITAFCGPVALVGMSIPILVRILNNNANVMLWMKHSFLYGGISILLTDIINQLFFDGSVPLNVLISMWAVPLLIWILIKQIKWENG